MRQPGSRRRRQPQNLTPWSTRKWP
jgi:hypothetical protein